MNMEGSKKLSKKNLIVRFNSKVLKRDILNSISLLIYISGLPQIYWV